MKNKNKKTENRGVGRPEKAIKWPNRKFTMADAVELNKGNCTKLCIIKHLVKDVLLGKKSEIIKLDEKRSTASGRGRKLDVYQKRCRQNILTGIKTTVKASPVIIPVVSLTAEVPAVSPSSPEFKTLTAELIGATPSPVETAPVAAPAPVAA